MKITIKPKEQAEPEWKPLNEWPEWSFCEAHPDDDHLCHRRMVLEDGFVNCNLSHVFRGSSQPRTWGEVRHRLIGKVTEIVVEEA